MKTSHSEVLRKLAARHTATSEAINALVEERDRVSKHIMRLVPFHTIKVGRYRINKCRIEGFIVPEHEVGRHVRLEVRIAYTK